MPKPQKNHQNIFFIFTVIFFILGILNIAFASVGIICILTPIILFAVYKERIWCKYYCPRAGFFTKVLSKISLKRKLPKFFTGKKLIEGVIIYFGVNLLFITMSTIMVSLGRIAPIEQIRFLIFFGLPITLPQLVSISAPLWLVHFGYRMYSVMFTSIVIGLVLGFIYMPRAWCVICPIKTITSNKKKAERNI